MAASLALSVGERLAKPKTKGSRRSVPIPPRLLQVLSEHQDATRNNVRPLGQVFSPTDGGLIRPWDGSTRDFRRVSAKAWLRQGIRLRDLRDTCATLRLGTGAHPKVVAARLRHGTTKLTLDTCSHVTPTLQGVATVQLAGVVDGGVRSSRRAASRWNGHGDGNRNRHSLVRTEASISTHNVVRCNIMRQPAAGRLAIAGAA